MDKTTEQVLEEVVERVKADLELLLKHGRDAQLEVKKEWPKEGDTYWSVDGYGELLKTSWADDKFDSAYESINNFFRTEREAERYKKRLQSMKKTWLPKKGEEYWYCALHDYVDSDVWQDWLEDVCLYHLGRVFKTQKEAKQWQEEYGSVWTTPDVEEGTQ